MMSLGVFGLDLSGQQAFQFVTQMEFVCPLAKVIVV